MSSKRRWNLAKNLNCNLFIVTKDNCFLKQQSLEQNNFACKLVHNQHLKLLKTFRFLKHLKNEN